MPAIIDKEKMRKDIMIAFRDCANDKPLVEVSLRDVAKKAGMSHAKVLYYFDSKEDLMIACSLWVESLYKEMIEEWFSTHHINDYDSKVLYLDDLFHYLANGNNEIDPKAVFSNIILGEYSPRLKQSTIEALSHMQDTFNKCLTNELDKKLTEIESKSVMLIVGGIFFDIFNGTMPDDYKEHIASHLLSFLK